MLWPGDSNVESSLISKETEGALDGLREIRSYAIEDDDILLSTLESIHSIHFDGFRHFTVILAAEDS